MCVLAKAARVVVTPSKARGGKAIPEVFEIWPDRVLLRVNGGHVSCLALVDKIPSGKLGWARSAKLAAVSV